MPVFFLVAHFSGEARGLAANVSLGIGVVLVKYFWDLRKRVWFWVVIALIATLHILIVRFLPLPDRRWNYVHWNYVQMLPFGLLDFGIGYSVIRLVESLMRKFEKPAVISSPAN